MTFFPFADHSPGLASLLLTNSQPDSSGEAAHRLFLRPLTGCCSPLRQRESALGELDRRRTSAMLALLFCGLLLAARGSVTWTLPDPEESSFGLAEIKPDLAEKISDTHAKVQEIWLELGRRREVDATEMYAVCQVQPSASLATDQPRVTGLVLFRQLSPGARLEAFFDLEGFPTEPNVSSRAIHVHQFGDLSQGCESTGPHYNPMAVQHPQHPGDFGNFVVRDGRLWKYRTGLAASLAGPHSILGRAVVVHAGEDDLGRGGNQASVENGNAGRRLACCVVGASTPAAWARQTQEHAERKKRRRESECKAA
ncbi:extracellular superoxide dismutase [Cu-Zn] [Peromyscus californicus insignis]|uniref:extracellular superoxide dismutase [Cu-Zn] n=1 Tax=Peromyscus californicus insignis TaxID=564181 RepID=UPI0022A69A49|nr:extracellular superoxide dismutase [Cu-Zn] [Peromyscus californicus insignis]